MNTSPPSKDPSVEKQPIVPRRFRPLLALILLTGVASLLFPDFFFAVCFGPINLLFQLLLLIYRGIPQNLTWGFFILLAIYLAVPAIIPVLQTSKTEPDETVIDSRLADLVRLEADARTSQHARWELAREIRKVAIDLLRTDPSDTPESLQQHLEAGEFDLSPVITELFAVCAHLPSYRVFMEAREAAPNGKIPELAALDLDAAVAALNDWRRPERETF